MLKLFSSLGLVAVVVASISLAACSSGGSAGTKPGAERGACYPNHTCNAGLTCASDVCVVLGQGGDGGTQNRDSGAQSRDGGTQDAGAGTQNRDSGTPTRDGGTADAGATSLTIEPANALLIVDTTATPVVAATKTYKVTLNGRDVSASATLTITDPTLGSFNGSTFSSATALPAAGAVTTVNASAEGVTGSTSLALLPLAKSGDKRDVVFNVSAQPAAPSPARDVLKLAAHIEQVDVAIVLDTTGSMGGSLNNLKANLTTVLFPALVQAIPSVQIAIVDQQDFPYSSYGAATDHIVSVAQTSTSNVTSASTALNAITLGSGNDGPEGQIPAMHYTLTGQALSWPGGSVPTHTPAAGTFGGVDFRSGSLPVVVEITDVDWHGEGHTPYSFAAPTMADLKVAFNSANARFIDITNGAYSAPEDQANDLSDATKSSVPAAAFGASCAAGMCCTGMAGAARAATGPGGTCRLNFLHNSGAGVSDSVVKAIQALAVGSVFDVTTVVSNDPSNAGSVDATKFLGALRAMEEGDSANGCPAHSAKDTTGDGVKDTFVSVAAGAPLCFEMIPQTQTAAAGFYRASVDIVGMPGSVRLDRRSAVFYVPPGN